MLPTIIVRVLPLKENKYSVDTYNWFRKLKRFNESLAAKPLSLNIRI